MTKIGILTIHSAHNYGAMLQAYATKAFLMKHEKCVDIINYQPAFLDYPYKAFNIDRMFRSKRPKYLVPAIIREFSLYWLRKKRRIRFEDFFNKYICPNMIPVMTIPSDYDIYIVGSDQVWNTDITLTYEKPYFADFPFPHESKRYISYASSLGKDSLNNYEINEFSKMLKNFDCISVRENSARKLLQPLVSKNIKVVLDPTLLLNRKDWNAICSSKRIINEKYVLVYQIFENPNVLLKAKNIAQEIGARVFQLVAWPNRALSDQENLQGPSDFVSLIRDADFVVTTSFHGTAFSVIFEKDFYVVRLNNGRDGRAENLLSSINLQNRIVELNENVFFSKIDYSEARGLLEQQKDESSEYLLSSIYGND